MSSSSSSTLQARRDWLRLPEQAEQTEPPEAERGPLVETVKTQAMQSEKLR